MNDLVDINDTKLDGKKVAYVSDTRVSSGGSYLIWSSRTLIPIDILEPTLNGQSYDNALSHKVKNMYENIKL